jgi:hypothetical protein
VSGSVVKRRKFRSGPISVFTQYRGSRAATVASTALQRARVLRLLACARLAPSSYGRSTAGSTGGVMHEIVDSRTGEVLNGLLMKYIGGLHRPKTSAVSWVVNGLRHRRWMDGVADVALTATASIVFL